MFVGAFVLDPAPCGVPTHPLFTFPALSDSHLPTFSGVLLSMGFGFVEYRKPEQAQKALKQLQVT